MFYNEGYPRRKKRRKITNEKKETKYQKTPGKLFQFPDDDKPQFSPRTPVNKIDSFLSKTPESAFSYFKPQKKEKFSYSNTKKPNRTKSNPNTPKNSKFYEQRGLWIELEKEKINKQYLEPNQMIEKIASLRFDKTQQSKKILKLKKDNEKVKENLKIERNEIKELKKKNKEKIKTLQEEKRKLYVQNLNLSTSLKKKKGNNLEEKEKLSFFIKDGEESRTLSLKQNEIIDELKENAQNDIKQIKTLKSRNHYLLNKITKLIKTVENLNDEKFEVSDGEEEEKPEEEEERINKIIKVTDPSKHHPIPIYNSKYVIFTLLLKSSLKSVGHENLNKILDCFEWISGLQFERRPSKATVARWNQYRGPLLASTHLSFILTEDDPEKVSLTHDGGRDGARDTTAFCILYPTTKEEKEQRAVETEPYLNCIKKRKQKNKTIQKKKRTDWKIQERTKNKSKKLCLAVIETADSTASVAANAYEEKIKDINEISKVVFNKQPHIEQKVGAVMSDTCWTAKATTKEIIKRNKKMTQNEELQTEEAWCRNHEMSGTFISGNPVNIPPSKAIFRLNKTIRRSVSISL